MKFEAPPEFSLNYLRQSACFEHLLALTTIEQLSDFPTTAQLNQWLPDGVFTTTTQPIQFIPQPDADNLPQGWSYEAHIATTGEVPTRSNNWHDLFGAIIWCLFPKTKAVFNHWHFQDLRAKQTPEHQKMRSQRRHVITALDECGVIIVSRNSEVVSALQQHRWRQGFWTHQACWHKDVLVFTIGHANYEMMTRPFLGLTAKAWHVPMPDEFFELPLAAQFSRLDAKLAEYLHRSAMKTVKSQLFPLPLLGIPGWYHQNKQASFYDNSDYFRPSRGRSVAEWDG